MAVATGTNVQDVCGSNQVCAGVKVGIEAVVHAMREMFEADECKNLPFLNAAKCF